MICLSRLTKMFSIRVSRLFEFVSITTWRRGIVEQVLDPNLDLHLDCGQVAEVTNIHHFTKPRAGCKFIDEFRECQRLLRLMPISTTGHD